MNIGSTGSGKSHTMHGGLSDRGIVERLVELLITIMEAKAN